MSYDTLNFEIDDHVAHLTVTRPESLNVLSREVLTEMRELLTSLRDREPGEVRGMLLSGAGDRAFIAGADIEDMDQMTPEEGEQFSALGQEVTTLLEQLPFPVIACVDGYALGGGCEMALACDYIYATEEAIFGQPEAALGLIPGFGGCVRLTRQIGPGPAREIIYTGRQVGADEALALGLVNRVLDSSEAMFEAARISIDRVSEQSPVGVSICKEVVNAASGRPKQRALEHERKGFRRAFESDDKEEGVSAFLEDRAPSFAQPSPQQTEE